MHFLSRMPKEQNSTLYILYLEEIQISEEEFTKRRGIKAETKKHGNVDGLVLMGTTDGFESCIRHLEFTLRVNVINLCLV